MTLKLATWNVNSIKQRTEAVCDWLREAQPDLLCLQEIKCQENAFPKGIFEDLGYNIALVGQKTFNGVAILSKWPLSDVRAGLPTLPHDEQARYLEAVVSLEGGAFRVASIYLPNGNPPDTGKYIYKLEWLEALTAHVDELLRYEEPLALAGDYNVIPQPEDVYNPASWTTDALFRIETRLAFRGLLNRGLTDAYRACDSRPGQYSFWDYQAGAWQRNLGLRIDHILLSPEAAGRLNRCGIDKYVRGREKPSDHVPVWAMLN
jgi:exodeoxyribonuclease-3